MCVNSVKTVLRNLKNRYLNETTCILEQSLRVKLKTVSASQVNKNAIGRESGTVRMICTKEFVYVYFYFR